MAHDFTSVLLRKLQCFWLRVELRLIFFLQKFCLNGFLIRSSGLEPETTRKLCNLAVDVATFRAVHCILFQRHVLLEDVNEPCTPVFVIV